MSKTYNITYYDKELSKEITLIGCKVIKTIEEKMDALEKGSKMVNLEGVEIIVANTEAR